MMAFPAIQERTGPHTRADLAALYALPENKVKRFELINGEIYEVPAASLLHNWIITQLVFLLKLYVDPRGLGIVFGDGAGFDLPNGDSVEPDVAFVSAVAATALPKRFDIAPDLAVEVVSPSNTPTEMSDKIDSYLTSGTKRVWVVYPERHVIEVFRRIGDRSTAYETYRMGDTVTGEGVLDGFSLPVADVFPKQQPISSSQPPATDTE
jgi:Uma2 family endonuclease